MRRKDREMSRSFGEDLIDLAPYGILSTVAPEGLPYALPLSIVRVGDALYFHSARAGCKVEVLRAGLPVQVVFVGHVKVPQLYSRQELDAIREDEHRASELTRRVFTTEYESAIAHGTLYEVTDDQEKEYALQALCAKYTPDTLDLVPAALRAGMSKTRIYRIDIESITAKRKKYDTRGEEMIYQRMV